MSRYLVSLDQSLTQASELYVDRASKIEEVGAARGGRVGGEVNSRTPPRSARSGEHRVTPSAVAADTLPQPSDSTAVRSYVLRTSRLDGIPGLVELTALYIGAFVALLIAVTLMALKEYAKEALGLSEHSCCTDVIIGGARASKGDGSIRPASTGYHRFPGDSAFCKRGFGSSGLVLGEES